ncbi:PTS sugar transporter subunit IIA [Bombilactobacillus thymidiniphilus]|uniref:Glycoside-pentoside-hexuronide (GPH):cation symporter n=1 Tax=Bombilactobacillus thymidiniphilus TaxID=2923363 RepID=A0ABY4PBE4_9LACO|nr:PTS sugar transporter subunit IIA [Bombilactobacillus thymidiniphilus]UQS83090.1 glycoside-pentoside-hexuronide (GPH):cation symporter [Bombilactobacillus thymidiniphilus]
MAKYKTRISYLLGAFGHDFFAAAMLTYFIMFITNHLFITKDNSFNNQMIGIVTTTMVVIRIIELFIDPFIGNTVDKTQTRWGKFKPWVIVGAVVSGITLVLLYTDMGGLATKNPFLYIVVFAVIYIIMDIFYSFKDIGLWSMVPALTLDSEERDTLSTWGRFGSTLGGNIVTLVVVPIALFFSVHYNEGQGDKRGWLAFGIITAILSILGACIIGFGTKEQKTALRTNKQNTSTKDVFSILFKNDQLMWSAITHFFFEMAWGLVNALLLYYFTFILGDSEKFTVYGTTNFIIGMISVALFPSLAHKFQRRKVFVIGGLIMIVGLVLLFFADNSSILSVAGAAITAAPQPLLFLVIMLTMTDTVEYGQLKLHHRDESLVLSVRPLIDKLASAIVNGLVSIIVIIAHMSGNARVSSITNADAWKFKVCMLAVPIVLLLIAIMIFVKKVTLTETVHAKIVDQLEKTWGQDTAKTALSTDSTTIITAPVAGVTRSLQDVSDKEFASGNVGRGLAISPDENVVTAPVSGQVRLVLPTKHAVGIVTADGLLVLVHVGINTVKLHGRGFSSSLENGQQVQAGDTLLHFDDQLIKKAGLDDTVLVTILNPSKVAKFELTVAVGQSVQMQQDIFQVQTIKERQDDN